jgi:fumarylacetoacetase
MSFNYDATCEPSLRSWVPSANHPDTDFPIQNLPFGVFRRGADLQPRIGIAIGDQIVDLRGLADNDLLAGLDAELVDACRSETLNALMKLGSARSTTLRVRLSDLLRENPSHEIGDTAKRNQVKTHLVAQHDGEMLLPATIGDYTDFYASIEHATRVGGIFRPERPLLPNYK